MHPIANSPMYKRIHIIGQKNASRELRALYTSVHACHARVPRRPVLLSFSPSPCGPWISPALHACARSSQKAHVYSPAGSGSPREPVIPLSRARQQDYQEESSLARKISPSLVCTYKYIYVYIIHTDTPHREIPRKSRQVCMHLALTARTVQGNFGIKRVFLPPSVYIRAHAHTFIAPAALMRGFFFSFRVYICICTRRKKERAKGRDEKERGYNNFLSPAPPPESVWHQCCGSELHPWPTDRRLASCGPVCASVYVSVALVSARGSS